MKHKSHIKPDLITFNTLIKGCALHLDWRLGLQLMEEVKSRDDLRMNAIT